MPVIVFSCPNCDTEIEVPDSKAGAKATCGECGERLQIPGSVKKTSVTAKRPTSQSAPPSKTPPPPPKKAPQLDKRRLRDEDEDEEDDEEPTKPTKKTPPTTKRRLRDDRDEADDEEPEEKKTPAKSKKKKAAAAQSSGMILWVALGVLVLGGMAAGAYFLFFKGEDKKPPARELANRDNTDNSNRDKPPTRTNRRTRTNRWTRTNRPTKAKRPTRTKRMRTAAKALAASPSPPKRKLLIMCSNRASGS
jgi:hypothetical protein